MNDLQKTALDDLAMEIIIEHYADKGMTKTEMKRRAKDLAKRIDSYVDLWLSEQK